MKHSTLLAIAVSGIAGAAIWAASPVLTGKLEPWDADGVYYIAALFATGLVCACIVPKPLWALCIGSILGQFLYGVFFVPLGPLMVIGLLVLVFWSLFFALGAFLGGKLRASIAGRAPLA